MTLAGGHLIFERVRWIHLPKKGHKELPGSHQQISPHHRKLPLPAAGCHQRHVALSFSKLFNEDQERFGGAKSRCACPQWELVESKWILLNFLLGTSLLCCLRCFVICNNGKQLCKAYYISSSRTCNPKNDLWYDFWLFHWHVLVLYTP